MAKKREDLSSLINLAKRKEIPKVIQTTTGDDKVREKKINFSFVLSIEQMQKLRNFVDEKRNSDIEFFNFNNTDAFREGLELLKSEHPDLKKRPRALKIPTRIGRRFGTKNGEERFPTSFSISEDERNFIYDFIYNKALENSRYCKENFFNEIINKITKINK